MPQLLIDYYRAIEDGSAKMLDAARRQDWDDVLRCEGACTLLIGQLRCAAQAQSLLPQQQQEKTRIMQRILRNDAQIRSLTEPWLPQLEHLLKGQPQMMH